MIELKTNSYLNFEKLLKVKPNDRLLRELKIQ